MIDTKYDWNDAVLDAGTVFAQAKAADASGSVTAAAERLDCITHDMAMDACDMSLEGASQEEFGWTPCPTCHGTGHTEVK